MVMIIGIRILCHPILSLITLVIDNLDTHFAIIPFCLSLYEYILNRTPLGLITIINCYDTSSSLLYLHSFNCVAMFISNQGLQKEV